MIIKMKLGTIEINLGEKWKEQVIKIIGEVKGVKEINRGKGHKKGKMNLE